jgi:TRAP-type C4-dicarboxylate transport system permease small subunit
VAVTLDRRALRRGAVTYLAIGAPCGLVIALAGRSGTSGNEPAVWTLATLVFIVVAPLAAGAVAGATQASPLMHGAVAVAIPAGAFLIVSAIVRGAEHKLPAPEVVTFLLFLAVFTSLGMLGGYLGFRRRQHLA